MPELINPREEKACQLRAAGKSQKDAFNEAFEISGDSKANNSSRFFRREDVIQRLDEIKHRRAILADLDDGWVLKRLKRIADANLVHFFTYNDKGEFLGVNLDQVRTAAAEEDKVAGLLEVMVEEFIDGPRDDPERIRRTKVKIESGRITALKMLGDWLKMWPPTKVAATDPSGENAAPLQVIEIVRFAENAEDKAPA